MAFVYVLWALAAVAVTGLFADVLALRRRTARQFAWSAIGLKSVVLVLFAGWWIALRLGLFQDWGDLATMAGIIVVSVPLLGIAIVCDGVILVSLRRTS